MPAFFGTRFYCEHCSKGYASKDTHRCQETCPCCRVQPKCHPDPQFLKCNLCNRVFANQDCFDRHKVNKCLFFDRYKVNKYF